MLLRLRYIVLVTTLLISSFSCSGSNLPTVNVLLVHSYSEDLPWTKTQHNTFKSEIKKMLPSRRFNFFVYFLDTKKLPPTKNYESSFQNYVQELHSDRKVDLIYTSDDNATNFFFNSKTGTSLFPDITHVFSGVNNLKLFETKQPDNVTGVFENSSIQDNIGLLISFDPNIEEVLLVGDDSPSAHAILNEINSLRTTFSAIDILPINDSSLTSLVNKVKLHPKAPVIFTAIGALRNDIGEHVSNRYAAEQFSILKRILLVTTPDFFSLETSPILGGYITTPKAQAKAAVKLALRSLKRVKAQVIPPMIQSPVELIIDYKRLKKLKLSIPDGLGRNLHTINEPITFWVKYPSAIYWALAVILITFFIVLTAFITYSRSQSRIIKEQATDSLTGLPNRTSLIQNIRLANSPTLAVLDIERFNSLNSFYGLETGDAILCHVAQSLATQASKSLSVYRLNGDIFALLAENDELGRSLKLKVSNILDSFSHHDFKYKNTNIKINFSAGISNNGSKDPLVDASDALKQAKEEQRYIVTYTEEQDRTTTQQKSNLMWVQKLYDAFRDNRIKPYYQVIVNNRTGERSKVESLVRLIEPDGKVVPPFFFLKAAQISRQYYQLTHLMIEKSLQDIANNNMTVSINFTIEDTQRIETLLFLKEQINKYDCANRVIIELTESEGIESYEDTIRFVQDVHRIGAKVAIDDFGAGYSNFMHLMSLKVDFLKIDGTIVKQLLDDPTAEMIVKALVNFAKELNMKTVAEFVDSEALHDKVIELGVDYSQGYFIGKPEPCF